MAFELYETPLYNDPSLLSLWRFEGNSTDSKGNYNGTDTSMTYGSGTTVFGQSAIFNGSTGYITIPSGMADFTKGVTMSVWAYPTSSVNYARFFDFGAASGAGGANLLLYRIATSATLAVYNGTASATIDNAIINNEWHHYVGTIDLGGICRLYRDGKQIGSGVLPLPPNSTRTTNLIGKSNWAGDALYAGYMDDAAIFTRALTDAEIQDLYNGTLTKYSKNSLSKYRKKRFTGYKTGGKRLIDTPLFNDSALIAYWKLNGNSSDSKGSYNGTDTSMTYPNENDYFGSAAYFNGTTSCIDVGNVAINSNDFTISMWIKRKNSNTLLNNYVCGKGTTLAADGSLHCGFRSTNVLTFSFYSDDANSTEKFTEINNWHLLTLTYNYTSKLKSIYFDGSLRFAATGTGNPNWGTTSMFLGKAPFTTSTFFNGYIADACVFNRVLSDTEISKLYYGFKENNNLKDYRRLENNTSQKQEFNSEITSPLQVQDCKLWIDVSKAIGLSDGDAIGSLPDLSGNGNNLVQATAAKKPIYKTNVLNGLPTMRGTAAASTTWDIPWEQATGGTITRNGNYVIHTFTGNGTFTAKYPLTCDVLIVAGGGGGGGGAPSGNAEGGGGGGAGGVLLQTSLAVAKGTGISVTVGGAGGGGGVNANGSAGGNSSFSTYTAIGGGYGAGGLAGGGRNGGNGGSGGGSEGGGTAGTGTAGQGNNGGNGADRGGGGGGKSGGGATGISSGNGGGSANYSSDFGTGFGSSGAVAGGGGGGGGRQGGQESGGTGGGATAGNGGYYNSGDGGSASANTGSAGGGGGVARVGGNGGSGVVVIRYLNPNTLFSVVRKTSTSGRVIAGKTTNFLFGYWSNYKKQLYAEGWVGANSDVANSTEFNVYSCIIDSSNSYLLENGQVVKEGTGGQVSPGGLTIGYVGTSEFSDHDIGEIIGFNRTLSDHEVAQVNNYLLKKWGQDYNLALGKPITQSWGGTHWYLTDGSNKTANYIGTGAGLSSVTIDLKAVYQVSRIDLWHYWGDGRTYYYNKTEVSADGANWVTIYDSEVTGRYAETYQGKIFTFTAIPVRYVKNSINGSSSNTSNHWVEMRVIGK